MKKEFLPYKESLTLKELGFDEECLGYYSSNRSANDDYLSIDRIEQQVLFAPYSSEERGYGTPTPLYQQVFRWFREKHSLVAFIDRDGGYWGKTILDLSQEDQEGAIKIYSKLHMVDDYRDAEDSLIQELIRIIK